MDTAERMMIVGLCLQGLLANSVWTKNMVADSRTIPNPNADMVGEPQEIEETFYRLMTDDELAQQRTRNVKEALRYAEELGAKGPGEPTDAERIAGLTRISYEALRAANADGAGEWRPYDLARSSRDEHQIDRVDGVFERASRWFHDPTGFPETDQDRIIAAIVAAGRPEE